MTTFHIYILITLNIAALLLARHIAEQKAHAQWRRWYRYGCRGPAPDRKAHRKLNQ